MHLQAFLLDLHRTFGDRLRTDEQALERASCDYSGYAACLPGAVIFPTSTEECITLVQAAYHRHISLVPRGAGTGKAGACIPNNHQQVVVDFSRMNRILNIRPHDLYAVVEPGVINATLQQELTPHHLMFPPDPASFESSTLGGNIATNAGGPRAVKYGVTERYVWGLNVVLGNGQALQLGRKSLKGVAGFNVHSLFVGSEGRLGVITSATLHVVPKMPEHCAAFVQCASVQQASSLAFLVLQAGYAPSCLELLDTPALQAIQPDTPFLQQSSPAALLIELEAQERTPLEQNMERMGNQLLDAGALDVVVAQSETQNQAMHRARKAVSGRLSQKYPFKLSDDIAVPRSAMPQLIVFAHQMAQEYGIQACTYGHLGDGNIHLNLLCKHASEREQAQQVREHCMRFAIAHQGTISGEHGIGIAKRNFLPLELSSNVLSLYEQLATVFDPHHIMNPEKIWKSPQTY